MPTGVEQFIVALCFWLVAFVFYGLIRLSKKARFYMSRNRVTQQTLDHTVQQLAQANQQLVIVTSQRDMALASLAVLRSRLSDNDAIEQHDLESIFAQLRGDEDSVDAATLTTSQGSVNVPYQAPSNIGRVYSYLERDSISEVAGSRTLSTSVTMVPIEPFSPPPPQSGFKKTGRRKIKV